MKYNQHHIHLKSLIDLFADEEYYQNYLIHRNKGLRKSAFTYLDKFLEAFQKKNKYEQQQFIIALLSQEHIISHVSMCMPYPLKKLLYSKIEEWCNDGTTDEQFYYWGGKHSFRLDYIHKSLEINPNFDKAKAHLIRIQLDQLYYKTHRLPNYYIIDGEETEELKLCTIIENKIQELSEEETKLSYLKKLTTYKNLIESYIEHKNTLYQLNWTFIPLSSRHSFVEELRREIGKEHSLADKETSAIAKSNSNDDVLYTIKHEDSKVLYYIFHLTYSPHNTAGFPIFEVFENINEVINHLKNSTA